MSKVHNHPPYRPNCNEGVVGACIARIDPEDREQVERLMTKLADALGWGPYKFQRGTYVPHLQAALREFANPTPPKPAEPTGLGAVVEDAEGVRWTRADTGPSLQWAKSDNQRGVHGWADYESIAALRVLSEGVTA